MTVVCRDADKGAATVAELRDTVPGLSADVVRCDLADLESVRRAGFELVDRYDAIDVLINNAGVNDTQSSLTGEGFDHMMASNYLGPFLLTRLVLDRVKAAAPARIVVVGSEAHRMAGPFDPDRFEDLGAYGPMNNNLAYGRTKLLDQLFTNELARRLEGTGVTANSVCPGLVATNLVDMGPVRPIMRDRRTHAVRQHTGRGSAPRRSPRRRSQAGRRHRPLLHHHAGHEAAPTRPGDARQPHSNGASGSEPNNSSGWRRRRDAAPSPGSPPVPSPVAAEQGAATQTPAEVGDPRQKRAVRTRSWSV